MEIKKISEFIWEIPKENNMNVACRIFASDKLIEGIKLDKTIEQIKNVAKLPGIVGYSIAMPDAHQGYGFSIGGVAAFDLEKGIISPGGVGYDINCGVRLLSTDISYQDFLKKKHNVAKEVFNKIPSGVGKETKKLNDEELNNYLLKGARYAVEKGFGLKEDLENCEEEGSISYSNPNNVSQRAKQRGKKQLGTLGSGNHFLEFQLVDEIYDDDFSEKLGIKKGTVCVMIHCGSRGLGHQVASDYIQLMEKEHGFKNLPDRELVNAPINSELGKKYLSAMNCAVNFAFANRQIIMHNVREILKENFKGSKNHLVYDVCHNVAKIEKQIVNGHEKKLCVHRKGATRAFEDQPVLIPGSMGTSSYLLIGTKKSKEISFGSTAHGAGRVLSRIKAIKSFNPTKIKEDLKKQGIDIYTSHLKGISEEAPKAYKNIDEVIRVSDNLGIAKKVARLKPLAVIKG